MKLEEHDVFDQDEDGYDTSRVIAHVKPASSASVVETLSASESDPDGRSNWVWVRLASGDLVLGIFPQGDTYFATKGDHP